MTPNTANQSVAIARLLQPAAARAAEVGGDRWRQERALLAQLRGTRSRGPDTWLPSVWGPLTNPPDGRIVGCDDVVFSTLQGKRTTVSESKARCHRMPPPALA